MTRIVFCCKNNQIYFNVHYRLRRECEHYLARFVIGGDCDLRAGSRSFQAIAGIGALVGRLQRPGSDHDVLTWCPRSSGD